MPTFHVLHIERDITGEGRVAARLDLPMAANVTEVRGDEVTRQRWGGTLLEEARVHSELKLFSAAPFAFEVCVDSTQSRVETFVPDLTAADTAVRVVETVSASTGKSGTPTWLSARTRSH